MDEDKYTCGECGQEVNKEDGEYYHGNFLCQDCYDVHFHFCVICDERYDLDGDGWGNMCEDCSDRHFECKSCGYLFSNNDYRGDRLCIGCYRHTDDDIKEYHTGTNCGIVFHPNNQQKLYFGVELETDYYDNRYEAGQELFTLSNDEELFWLEQDSSLHNGIEIISQPCTLDYHKDKFPWTKITKVVANYGGKSHNTYTCGLHIHFSRTFIDGKHSELYQLRLIYLFEKFWDELVIFSRRNIDQLEQFAKKYDTELLDKSARAKLDDLRQDYFNHYQCINLANTFTIEIRMFKGSLKVETILAAIELVDYLVRLVKRTTTKQLQSLTWAELINKANHKQYQYLPQYLEEKGLLEEGKNVSNRSQTTRS